MRKIFALFFILSLNSCTYFNEYQIKDELNEIEPEFKKFAKLYLNSLNDNPNKNLDFPTIDVFGQNEWIQKYNEYKSNQIDLKALCYMPSNEHIYVGEGAINAVTTFVQIVCNPEKQEVFKKIIWHFILAHELGHHIEKKLNVSDHSKFIHHINSENFSDCFSGKYLNFLSRNNSEFILSEVKSFIEVVIADFLKDKPNTYLSHFWQTVLNSSDARSVMIQGYYAFDLIHIGLQGRKHYFRLGFNDKNHNNINSCKSLFNQIYPDNIKDLNPNLD